MPYSSEIANFVLYTPLDTMAVVENSISSQLTYEEFICNCYVKPRFKKELEYRITDDNVETYDYIIKYEHLKDLQNKQQKEYDNFKKWIESEKNYKVYTISGNAGTGKTTFIHRLKYENPVQDWIILDVSKAKDFVDWFHGTQTSINNFQKPYNKLYAIILEHLQMVLFGEKTNTNLRETVCNLQNIANVYLEKYIDYDIRGGDYILGLINLFNNIDASVEDKDFMKRCAKYTQSYFKQDKRSAALKEMFRKALDVLLIVVACADQRNNHIIVFDNIERFISHDEIYNEDLDQIRRELASYSQDVNQRNDCYQCMFKFILCMRTSSARMLHTKLHSADELASDLNLTDWFLIDDIIATKLKWYDEHNIKCLNVEMLNQIICDLRTCYKNELTGLQLFVQPLFNENIRLIIDFIGNIIERTSNSSCIECYKELWKEDTAVSRFAARNVIRGLIYQELDKNDNLFQHLHLYTEVLQKQKDETRQNYGLSYVRKILTVLYNQGDNEVLLSNVIGNLCNIKTNVQKYWEQALSNENKDNLSEVLFYMNSYNRRENDWIQFVDLQISGVSHSTSIEDVESLRKLIDKKLNKINLKIMPAGKAYLRYIVPSFEYFSFRFYKKHVAHYYPLFSVVPSMEDLQSCRTVKDLMCYTIINYVKENAFGCIENIQENGDIKLNISEHLVGKKHTQRIINHHQGYIDKFVKYIKERYKEDFEAGGKSKELIDECIDIRGQYNKYKEQ